MLSKDTRLPTATISTISEADIKVLYDRLKNDLAPTDDSEVTPEDQEEYYKQSQPDFITLKEKLEIDIGSLTGKVDSLQDGMQQQQEARL
jgi:hypothetical protein